MRFVVHGAGAVGGVVGGRLFQAGHEVVLIARGAHGAAIAERGLRVVAPDRDDTLPVPVVAHPRELAFRDGDVVLLAVKTQDTPAALRDLALAASADTPLVCAQNGVANEDLALRHFANVYGMRVVLPALHVEPGVVQAHSAPYAGTLDLGRYPHDPDAADPTAHAIAEALRGATFGAEVRPEIMRWKYAKLLLNLSTAVEALCGPEGRRNAVQRLALAEGHAVYEAAGIVPLDDPADPPRRERVVDLPVGGVPRPGGSAFQSLLRGAGSIETDYINGEVVRLGRLHGVPTPVNEAVHRIAVRHAVEGRPPGTATVADILAEADAITARRRSGRLTDASARPS
ncbi:ketopantoate reductase family protein [Yinghuangia seranimata]|uniref:ketopantoate reductase family protein n=1 Tax=Yinghuangia seranimata TaxID=408067 RepID=UPI00248CEEF7|nr:2-dehydropantoate 2-reductase N-terminal domain-containing protein [Yinghuangia seranimata]MDI2132333.1 2-dehydropantoate 2-reductase N-terminal domain-containing protein [Yinghuangia seranimata]